LDVREASRFLSSKRSSLRCRAAGRRALLVKDRKAGDEAKPDMVGPDVEVRSMARLYPRGPKAGYWDD
jgi:hypothetical protein